MCFGSGPESSVRCPQSGLGSQLGGGSLGWPLQIRAKAQRPTLASEPVAEQRRLPIAEAEGNSGYDPTIKGCGEEATSQGARPVYNKTRGSKPLVFETASDSHWIVIVAIEASESDARST